MCARDRTERQDQDGQDRAGRKGVAKQRERAVAARQLGGHDAGADHRRQQKGGAQALGDDALRECGFHVGSAAFAVASFRRPISRSSFCRLN